LKKDRFAAWLAREGQKLGVEVNYDIAIPTSVGENQNKIASI
jgi:hypothetical protein